MECKISIHGSTELINILYIYASSRPHKHYKIDFTPKLSSHQHVKYGSNLMNFFFKFHFWGVLGKRMLNSEVLKCHEDLITLETYVQQGKQWIISFSCVKTLTSLAIWEGGGGGRASIIRLFTSTLSLIIIYMSNIEAS